MACCDSVEFVKGANDIGLAHYHVELTEAQLNTFEALNSMCLLDNFDHLLFFLECQMYSSSTLAVPPFDIILVLLTLATVSDHYKDNSTRLNDPYNVSRASLSKRALKILSFYLEALKEFDTTKHDRYKLELLRCQLFLASDSLSPSGSRSGRPRKLRKTLTGVVYDEESRDVGDVNFKEPYKSYLSCLGQKRAILGNRMINAQLSSPGEFLNMIVWTLSNSMQELPTLYLTSHEVWMPMLEIILDLLELRQDYFILQETKEQKLGKAEYVQILGQSPVAVFLETVDSLHFTELFCEYVFSKCDYPLSENAAAVYVHPVYRGEATLSNTFRSRTKYTKSYKIKKSLALRRRLVGIAFKLLSEVPSGHRLVYPRMEADELIHQISIILSRFRNLEQFQAFFSNNPKSSYFLPLLAEGTLLQIFHKFKNNNESLNLVIVTDLLNDANAFLSKCINILETGMFIPWNEKHPQDSASDICKADTCMLVLIKTFFRLCGVPSSSNTLELMLSTVQAVDSKRQACLPRLHSSIFKLINS